MKHLLFAIIVIGVSLFLGSCQNSEFPETTFYRDFNLGASVQKMQVSQLHSDSGGGGAETAVGSTTRRRRDFRLDYTVEDQGGKRFDEELFLNGLRAEIAYSLGKSGVRSDGAGSGGDSFYFNYSQDDTNIGSIEVVGTRVEGNRYKLWCVIRETSKASSNS